LYAAAKAEKWEKYAREVRRLGNAQHLYDDWSTEFDETEFDAWEASALNEFESGERARLEKFSWVRWT